MIYKGIGDYADLDFISLTQKFLLATETLFCTKKNSGLLCKKIILLHKQENMFIYVTHAYDLRNKIRLTMAYRIYESYTRTNQKKRNKNTLKLFKVSHMTNIIRRSCKLIQILRGKIT